MQHHSPSGRRARFSLTHFLGMGMLLVLMLLLVLPQIGVLVAAVMGSTDTLRSLWSTVLGGYIRETALLLVLVMGCSAALGSMLAWLMVHHEFPLRGWLEVALVLPLAFPAYVLAYAYTDLLDHPGAVQTALRAAFGWGPRDYWFPEVRSLGGAAAMLTLVLYPYVYLLARSAFKAQNPAMIQAARALGRSHFGAFRTVSLPLARPAIAAGTLLVGMETIADFGTVSYFGVNTFAVGIYTSWFSIADRAGAAQLSLGLLAFALLLVWLERVNRGQARYAARTSSEAHTRHHLKGWRAWAVPLFCALPALFGALLPAGLLLGLALESEQSLFSERYLGFIRNSVVLGVIAALCTVAVAVLFGSIDRIRQSRASRAALQIGRLGYAVPGGVIAVGLLVPFAAFDNSLDALMRETFGISTGLLFTGSIWLLVLAYVIRFLAAALGAYDAGIAGITMNVDAAARALGQTPAGLVRRVHAPIMWPSLLTALLIVFVDTMKELPATLIMRPFNFDTLAVQAHRLAADERLEGAAVPSLVIAAIGLIPVILLCRRMRHGQR